MGFKLNKHVTIPMADELADRRKKLASSARTQKYTAMNH